MFQVCSLQGSHQEPSLLHGGGRTLLWERWETAVMQSLQTVLPNLQNHYTDYSWVQSYFLKKKKKDPFVNSLLISVISKLTANCQMLPSHVLNLSDEYLKNLGVIWWKSSFHVFKTAQMFLYNSASFHQWMHKLAAPGCRCSPSPGGWLWVKFRFWFWLRLFHTDNLLLLYHAQWFSTAVYRAFDSRWIFLQIVRFHLQLNRKRRPSDSKSY